jgi:predicted ATPase
MPELRDQFPDVQPLPSSDPEQARFRLFDSCVRCLKAVAAKQPLLLLLDDLQWADAPSLLFLQFLAREIEEARVLLLLTCRETEVERQPLLAQTLAALARAPGSQTLQLRGLAKREVHRFIELTTGQPPSETLATAVCRETVVFSNCCS